MQKVQRSRIGSFSGKAQTWAVPGDLHDRILKEPAHKSISPVSMIFNYSVSSNVYLRTTSIVEKCKGKGDMIRYNASRIDLSSTENLTQVMSNWVLWCPNYVGGQFKQKESKLSGEAIPCRRLVPGWLSDSDLAQNHFWSLNHLCDLGIKLRRNSQKQLTALHLIIPPHQIKIQAEPYLGVLLASSTISLEALDKKITLAQDLSGWELRRTL